MAVGVAVELALKAAIATVLPSLLAEKGDPHSQLILMGRASLIYTSDRFVTPTRPTCLDIAADME